MTATSESASDSEILGSAADVAVDSGVEESEDSSESIDLSGLTAYQRAPMTLRSICPITGCCSSRRRGHDSRGVVYVYWYAVSDRDAGRPGTDGLPAGYEGKAVVTAEKGYIEWEVDVGCRVVQHRAEWLIRYPAGESRLRESFRSTGRLRLTEPIRWSSRRVWADEGPVMVDTAGNEIRPRRLSCQGGRLYLSLTLLATLKSPTCSTSTKDRTQSGSYRMRKPLAISHLKLCQFENPRPYAEIEAEFEAEGL